MLVLSRLCRGGGGLLQLRLGASRWSRAGAGRLQCNVALSSRLPLSASVAPQPRRALCSASAAEDVLWDYYQQHKPTVAPEEIYLPEIYERDTQLKDLAEDAETAFKAYKCGSKDRSSYVLPVCYGASGSGKTTLGDLMLRDLEKVVANKELKMLL